MLRLFVLLMDLHMPNMGGVEATEQILSKYPSSALPIVAATADAFEDSKEKCMRVGFRDWLSKPFRVEQLHELLLPSRLHTLELEEPNRERAVLALSRASLTILRVRSPP